MKNAKLFSKISPIDLTVILLILLLLVGVAVRFISFSGGEDETPAAPTSVTVPCTVTVRFEEVTDALRREPFAQGDTITLGGKTFGKITSFTKERTRVETMMDDGTTAVTESADEYTYIVTVSANLESKNGLLYSTSGMVVGVGQECTLNTRLFSHKATVINVGKNQ